MAATELPSEIQDSDDVALTGMLGGAGGDDQAIFETAGTGCQLACGVGIGDVNGTEQGLLEPPAPPAMTAEFAAAEDAPVEQPGKKRRTLFDVMSPGAVKVDEAPRVVATPARARKEPLRDRCPSETDQEVTMPSDNEYGDDDDLPTGGANTLLDEDSDLMQTAQQGVDGDGFIVCRECDRQTSSALATQTSNNIFCCYLFVLLFV